MEGGIKMICEIRFNDNNRIKIINVIATSYHKEGFENDVYIYTRNKKTGNTKEIAYRINEIKSLMVRESR
jgi:hypothetical protein